jgi:hypothetical protein
MTNCGNCEFFSERTETFGICRYKGKDRLFLVRTCEQGDTCKHHCNRQSPLPGIIHTIMPDDRTD